jgi:hypothetical protein
MKAWQLDSLGGNLTFKDIATLPEQPIGAH